MTIRDLVQTINGRAVIAVTECGKSIARFDACQWDSIKSAILDSEVAGIEFEQRFMSWPVVYITAAVGDAVTVSTQAELQAAMDDENVTDIRLLADIKSDTNYAVRMLSGTKNLYLNGHSILAVYELPGENCAAIRVEGGTLTIYGDEDSHVIGSVGCTTGFAVAAYFEGTEVHILGGVYDTALDENGDTNSVIYAAQGAKIFCSGGTYRNSGAMRIGEPGHVLNIQNGTGSYIYCSGGEYWNQNPADGDDKDTDTGKTFLAPGCSVTESLVTETTTIYTVTKDE